MSIARLLGVWLLMAVAMSLNGILRETVLVRAIGREAADVASAAIGIVVILAITYPFTRPLVAHPTSTLVAVAVAWLVLTMAFEFLFGHFVDHKSWSELAANYAIWRGHLWPIVLAVVVLSPFIWGRWLAGGATPAP